MRRMRLRYCAVVLAIRIRSVCGQSTNTTCVSNSTTSWLFNKNEESPCLVWSRLQSLCLDSNSFVNVPPLLDPSWGYNAPQDGGDMCQCNVISYNLMAGCTWCQVGDTSNWVDEGTWQEGCGGVYDPEGLGFAQNVEILPAFAFKPWGSGKWDASLASSAASLPTPTETSAETTLSRSLPPLSTRSLSAITSANASPTTTPADPSPRPSSSASSSSFSSSSPSASSSSTPFQPDAPSQAAKWGPIIGGIAGGTFLLVLLFGLYRWYTSHHTSKPSKTNTQKRIPHPYPAQSTRSISNIFGSASKPSGEADDEYDRKRVTELMSDPRSFVASRPAPLPDGEGKGRYLTTTERLRDRPVSLDSVSDVGEFGREDPYTPGGQGQGGLIVDSRSTPGVTPIDGYGGSYSPNPRQYNVRSRETQDFSRPTSSANDMQDLSSLYDPPTEAPRYVSMTRSSVLGGRETLMSPMSRYPATERGVSEFGDGRDRGVGEALGSGRGRDRFSRGLVPVPNLPRGISDESV